MKTLWPQLPPRAAWPRVTVLALAGALPWAVLAEGGSGDKARVIVSAPLQVQAGEGLQRLSLPLQALAASSNPQWDDIWLVDAQGQALPQAWADEPLAAPSQPRWVGVPMFVWPADAPLAGGAGGRLRLQIDASGAVVRIDGDAGQPAPPTSPAPGTSASAGAAPAAPTDANRATAWLLDLHGLPGNAPTGTALPIRRLRLHWPPAAQGLRRQARVEASDDAQQWRDIGNANLIEARSAEAAASAPGKVFVQQDIAIATTGPTPRYLRIQLDQALSLLSVEAEFEQPGHTAALQTLRRTANPLPASRDEAGAPGWQVDLGGPVPVRQMQIHLPQLNQVAQLEVSWRSTADEPWHSLTRQSAYRLQRGGQIEVSPAFDVSAPPARYWRLRPLDGGGAGAGVGTGVGTGAGAQAPELSLGWLAPQLAFAARGPQPYQLRIGPRVPGEVATRLSVASLIPGYEAGREYALPQAQLGTFSSQAVAEPTALQRLRAASAQDRKRWLLWGVLGLAVLALGWMATSLRRDVDAARPAQDL